MMTCPVTVDLDQNVAICNGKIVRLTPKEAEILYAIAARHPEPISIIDIGIAAYGLFGSSECSIRSTQCKLPTLRNKLLKTGVGLVNFYGRGYALDASGKENMRASNWSKDETERLSSVIDQPFASIYPLFPDRSHRAVRHKITAIKGMPKSAIDPSLRAKRLRAIADLKGLPVKTIAKSIGTTPGTVSGLVYRYREKINELATRTAVHGGSAQRSRPERSADSARA